MIYVPAIDHKSQLLAGASPPHSLSSNVGEVDRILGAGFHEKRWRWRPEAFFRVSHPLWSIL
jgi:hypothetical protein